MSEVHEQAKSTFKEYHLYSNELMEEYNKLFFELKSGKSFE